MLLILLGRLIQIALTLVLTKAATTLLSPTEYGRTALIASTISLFSLLLVNPVGMFINRRLHGWADRGSLLSHLRLYWLYLLGVAMLAACGVMLGEKIGFLSFGSENVWLVGLVCGSLIATTLNLTYIPTLNMLGGRNAFVVLSALTLAFNLTLSIAFVQYGGASAEHWMLGTFLAQGICAVWGALLLRKRVRSNDSRVFDWPDKERVRGLFTFAWPVSIAVGLTWAQAQSYRYFVEATFSAEALGYFVAGYVVASGIINAFEAVMHAYFLPNFYSDVSSSDVEKQAHAWNRYAFAVFPSYILTGSFVAIFAIPLSVILLGDRYHDVAVFAAVGALVEVARAFAGAYALVAHARMLTKFLIFPSAVGAVLALALVPTLTRSYGLVGTGVALALSGWAVVVVMHLKMQKILPIRFPLKRIGLAVFASMGLAVIGKGLAYFELMSGSLIQSLFVVAFAGSVYSVLQFRLLRNWIK